MAERSGIEWCTSTWNPWRGCSKVSPGCAHCYMFREQIRYGRDPEVVVRSKTTFADPLKWTVPRVVFTCSWSDWFHEAADQWRDEAWDVIRRTPQHTYLVLTKRPERMESRIPWGAFGDPWPNVWLGVSVENQRFVHRLATLNAIPATVRFLSAEPLLGPLNVREHLGPTLVSWVIVGGESGPNSRSMDLEWARWLRDQSIERGAAYFLKQLGGWPDKHGGTKATLDGRRWTERPGLAAPPRSAPQGETT
jgi:protein gp37